MNKILYDLRLLVLFCLKLLFSWWRKPLDKIATIQVLNQHIIYQKKHPAIKVFPYRSPVDEKSQLSLAALSHNSDSTNNLIDFEPDYVWQISRDRNFAKLQICASGNPLIDNNLVLNLDYGTVGALKELPIKLKDRSCELVVAPWSHNFGGYYAFLLLILTKLCRIESVFGRDIWRKAKLCYPLLHTGYERQYLEKLGIKEDALVDTRTSGTVKPQTLILANNQTEINRISPHDIALLRARFLPKSDRPNQEKKIFLPRRGRRKILNEAEIRQVLLEYNFEIIEDTYRTVDEQIALFNSASTIVSVHGAGLSNLVWCKPRTKIIELFYSGYNIPCFYYLSAVLNLEYACLFDRSQDRDSFANQYRDLEIDPQLLRSLLDRLKS